MLEDEIERMKTADEERVRQHARLDDLSRLSAQWGLIQEHLTVEDRARIVDALVTDITISEDDEITITGTLSSDGFENAKTGSPAGIRTPNLSVNSRPLYR
jgi:hypothetical protein